MVIWFVVDMFASLRSIQFSHILNGDDEEEEEGEDETPRSIDFFWNAARMEENMCKIDIFFATEIQRNIKSTIASNPKIQITEELCEFDASQYIMQNISIMIDVCLRASFQHSSNHVTLMRIDLGNPSCILWLRAILLDVFFFGSAELFFHVKTNAKLRKYVFYCLAKAGR